MVLLSMTMLTSFVNMKGRKEEKSIESLWEAYRKAEQLDQINKMTDVLEEIKTKARAQRASWDFYDASYRYVNVKTRRDWKLLDSLQAQMRKDVKEYDEPLLTYFVDRNQGLPDDYLQKVVDDASRLRKSRIDKAYTGMMNPALRTLVRNDYEFVLWDMFRIVTNRRSETLDQVYSALSEEVAGVYPQEGLADYYYALNTREGEDKEVAMKELADRYQGRALALLPLWILVEDEFRKNQDTASSEYFIDLLKRLESYEHEREMYKTGADKEVVSGMYQFRYLIDHMKAKAVQVKVKDGKAEIALRNLDKVKVRITKENETVFETVVENPVRSFYALDTLALELPDLDDGDYRIRCLYGKDEIGQCHYPKFTLSVSLRDDSEGKRVYVADYKTGEPVAKVDMNLYKGDRLVEEATNVELNGFTLLPDNIASVIAKNKSSYYLVCTAPGTRGTLRRTSDMYVSGNARYGESGPEVKSSLARLMLDRSAFRPGETVKFKAVVYDVAGDGSLSAAQGGRRLTARLIDASGNEIDRSEHVLNDFGSFAGEFVLDDIKRNGTFFIQVDSGTRRIGLNSFTVDEFQLPTFDVSFEDAGAPFLPGDTIVVKGHVTSYSGHSLASATVEAKVMFEDKLIKQENVAIAPDGSFSVSFVDSEKDEYSYSPYETEIKVTDLTGETLSFRSRQYVMRKPRLSVGIGDKEDGSFELVDDSAWSGVILGDNVAKVSFTVSDYGGVLYAGLPLSYHVERDGKKLFEASAVTGQETEIDLTEMQSGLYNIVAKISLTDARGREITAETFGSFVKVADDDTRIDSSFENLFRVVDEDEVALQFGAGNGPVWAVVELFGDKGQLLKSEIIRLEAGQMRIIRYGYKAEYPEGVRLNVLYFRNSQCHTYNRVWRRPVPSSRIPIEVLRFEDLALPKAACSVQLRVPADCEVLASVFDVSTERIRQNKWSEVSPYARSVASVNYSNAAGMDGSGYAAMMGDVFNTYNNGYVFDDVALGETIVVGYGQPRRKLLRTKSSNSEMADYVRVEEETVADEAIPLQLAAREISLRQDFATTLAFEPFLRPSDDGLVNLDFKASDKISTFVVSIFAHDKDMRNSVLRREMIVTLPVKVDVVQPQYLHAGDKYVLNASVSSTSELPVAGVAKLEVYASDSYEGAEPVMTAAADVTVPAGGSVPVSFEIDVPAGMSVMGLKVTFTGEYEGDVAAANDALVTDGVFVTIPIYPAEQVLEEAHSAVLLHGMSEEELLESLRKKFVNVSSIGAEYSAVSIMDMLREALPLVVEADSKDVVSQSEAMYVNLLAAGLQGQEGKPVREYVAAAMTAAEKILACANADGGFGWFEGMKSSPIVTASVLDRFAGLRDRRLLNVVSEEFGEDALDAFDEAVTAAVKYLDAVYFSDPDRPSWYGSISLWQYMQVRSMYVGVPFDKSAAQKAVGAKEYKEFRKMAKAFLTPKKDERWTDGAVMSKVRMIRIVNNLLGSSYGEELADAWGLKLSSKLRKSMAVELASLKEYAVKHPSGGMYYPNAVLPFRGLLESEAYAHAMICDLFKELSSDPDHGEGLAEIADAVRIWIMLQKETQQWSSDPGFVEAMASVYDGSDAVKDTKVVILSKRFSKPFEEIKAAGNGFKVSAKYYREIASVGSEPERVELAEGDALKLGEKIVAVYSVWSGENRSFVRLSVPRPACFRPEMQLSGWSGGWFRPLAYGIYSISPYAYREVKADRTLYWIDVFPEENSKIEEALFVTQEGVFTAPVAEIESLYAPHYRANDSFGFPVVVE